MLSSVFTDAVLESLANVVHSSMSDQGRFYHRTEHVFDLFGRPGDDPLVTLAALFHDTVYTQVDGGLPASVEKELSHLVILKDGAYFVQETPDNYIHMVNCVFGFPVGHKLGMFAGLNEYLSALLAVSQLKELCTRQQLLQVSMCIEATIPFRKPDDQGKRWTDKLFERSWAYVHTNYIAITEDDVVKATQRAVVMANNDVGGFSAEDTRFFLKNTWNLLPESNPMLRHPGLYTLKEYRTSLLKSLLFLNGLDPKLVFHQYQGVPADAELDRRMELARTNLSLTVLYMKYKVITSALLEAVAALTGGDGPISQFLGQIHDKTHRIDAFLTELPLPKQLPEKIAEVLSFLQGGRGSQTVFDLEESPTAVHVLCYVRDEVSLDRIFTQASLFFDGKVENMTMIREYDVSLARDIVAAMAHVAKHREEALLALLDKIVE